MGILRATYVVFIFSKIKYMMKLWVKNNWKYLMVFLICTLIMCYGILEEQNVFEILKRAFFEPGYKENFFAGTENAKELANVEPSVINIIKHVLSNAQYTLDVSIIFGTRWFQILIPLFAIMSGVVFYNSYNTVMNFEFYRKTKYRPTVFGSVLKNSLKIAVAIFLAYLIFLLFINNIATSGWMGSDERSFFSDILGNRFFIEHTLLYFVLEGIVRFLLIPFAYATLAQSIVLLGKDLKEVIAAPILYYYGLSAVGYAASIIVPWLAIYINPSVIMASGTYDNYSSIILILVNLIPLFIGLGIIYWRTRYVEL